VDQKVFEEALAELREYAKRSGMLLTAAESSIKAVKDVTEEAEECMLSAVWEELKDAEETCRKSCLITGGETSKWQRECIKTCLKCWEMTKRAECAREAGARQIEHLYVMENILELRGLRYYSYWHVDIDEKVFFVAEFKPPPEIGLQEKA